MDERSLRKIMGRLGITILNKSSTGWLQARCPFAVWTHKNGFDRHPGFACHVDETGVSGYKCLACGHHGRISSLIRNLEYYRQREYPGLAYEADDADSNGVFSQGWDEAHYSGEIDDPVPIDETMVAGVFPPVAEVPAAVAYLRKRGISRAAAELLELCYDPDEKRILFPVRGRNNELFGFTGRSILENPEELYRGCPKVRDYLGLPKRQLLLGINSYRFGKPLLVIEGLFGLASLISQGAREICNPVALMGSVMTPAKAHMLSILNENIYLLFDDDMGGDIGLFGPYDKVLGDHKGGGAIDRLLDKGCAIYVPSWPPETFDPDELSLEDVRRMIDHCPMWSQSLTKKR